MLAKDLVRKMGSRLIGSMVVTPAVGDYPGGYAKVVEIHPDPAAPEIVFNVEHPEWKDEDDECSIMGIFENEEVSLVEEARV